MSPNRVCKRKVFIQKYRILPYLYRITRPKNILLENSKLILADTFLASIATIVEVNYVATMQHLNNQCMQVCKLLLS